MFEALNFKKIKFDKNSVLVALAVLSAFGALLVFLNSSNRLSVDSIAKKSLDFINDILLQGQQTASLISVSREAGLVKMKIEVEGTSFDSYVTQDGKLFFPQAFDLKSDSSNPVGLEGQQNQEGNQGGLEVDIEKVKVEGEPFIGNKNAPVVMAEWFDYQCPFCKKLAQEVISQLIKDYVDKGQLKIVFKDFAFLGSDSDTAALVGRAVWELAPAKFYQWHEAMFEKQDGENKGWGSKEDVLALTASLGIDRTKMEQLLNSKGAQYKKAIDDSKTESKSFGNEGTPATIIGKQSILGAQPYSTFKSAVDSLLTAAGR